MITFFFKNQQRQIIISEHGSIRTINNRDVAERNWRYSLLTRINISTPRHPNIIASSFSIVDCPQKHTLIIIIINNPITSSSSSLRLLQSPRHQLQSSSWRCRTTRLRIPSTRRRSNIHQSAESLHLASFLRYSRFHSIRRLRRASYQIHRQLQSMSSKSNKESRCFQSLRLSWKLLNPSIAIHCIKSSANCIVLYHWNDEACTEQMYIWRIYKRKAMTVKYKNSVWNVKKKRKPMNSFDCCKRVTLTEKMRRPTGMQQLT